MFQGHDLHLEELPAPRWEPTHSLNMLSILNLFKITK